MEKEDIISTIKIKDDIWYEVETSESRKSFSYYPHRLIGAAFVFVTEGSATVSINISDYEVQKGSFITIAPNNIVQFTHISNDFSAFHIAFSSNFLSQTILNQPIPPFLFSANQRPVLMLYNNPDNALLCDYLLLFQKVYESEKGNPTSLVLKSLIISIMYKVGAIYESWPDEEQADKHQKRNALYRQLVRLIIKYYNKERNVAFYAAQLQLTPKYLSSVILKVRGRRVSDLISRAVIMDAKSQLKSSNLTIQQISDTLNFPDASLFGKYFKKHTGVTPGEYRKS